MDQLITVILFAAVIFVITLIAGRLPFLIKSSKKRLHALIAFSAGVMVGVLFIMLMPESLERTIEAGYDYTAACYMILIGFVLLLGIDFAVKYKLNADHHCCDECDHNITSMSAFAGLAIHSFFDGLALAAAFLAGEEVGILVLIAMCMHKAVVVFSLSSTILMSKNRKKTWNYIIAFSVISPIATVISYLFMSSEDMGFAGLALCFSVGIFMFVTMCDMVPEAFHHRYKDPKQMMFLIIGIALVAIISFISTQLMGGVDI